MKTLIVTDFDGTLVDTKAATMAAYAEAGDLMPKGAYGRPWREWTTEEVFRRKCEALPSCLRQLAKRLPLCSLAEDGQWPVVTAASPKSVQIACEVLALKLNVVALAVTIRVRIAWLDAQPRADWDERVYIDDDPSNREQVMIATNWTVLTPDEALRRFLP